MSTPPHKRKAPPPKCKASLMKTFWRRFCSHHLIVRFTDFLVHKSLFTKKLLISSSRNSVYDGATAETANVVRALAIAYKISTH